MKKALVLFVIGFAAYYLFTAPEGAADAVSGIFEAILDAFGQVMTFVDELFSS